MDTDRVRAAQGTHGLEHGLAVGIGGAFVRRAVGQTEVEFGLASVDDVFGSDGRGGLFRFEQETIATIEVDLACGDPTIGVVQQHGAF